MLKLRCQMLLLADSGTTQSVQFLSRADWVPHVSNSGDACHLEMHNVIFPLCNFRTKSELSAEGCSIFFTDILVNITTQEPVIVL